ncbi:hypothetical protein ODU13_08940 [Streptococcus suis]
MSKFTIEKIFLFTEILILFLLTLGPIPSFFKLILYVFMFILNIKHIKKIFTLEIIEWLFLLTMVYAMLLDFSNIDFDTPYSLAGFSYLLPFFIAKIYLSKYDLPTFLREIEKFTFVISIISLIGFSLQIFYPSILLKFPTIVFYGRPVKSILLFSAISEISVSASYSGIFVGNFLLRNSGIAFEPGAFQFVSNLGLCLVFYLSKLYGNKMETKRIFIYVITTLTTLSSTGIAILFIILVLNLYKEIKNIFLITIGGLGGRTLLINLIDNQVKKMESGNFNNRFENSIYVIKNYPFLIFGIGSTGYDNIYSQNTQIGSWDLYTNLYLRFGIIYIFLLIYLLYKLARWQFTFFILLALTFLTESILGPITMMLILYANSKKNLR